MELSVIIPAYNEEKHIGKCISSVKSQDKKIEHEIIVSCSGTDNTAYIAKKAGAKTVFGPKKGPAFGRNIGAKKAKGKYLLFIDADSTIDKNVFSALSDGMRDGRNAVFLAMLKQDKGGRAGNIIFKAFNAINGFLIRRACRLAVCTGSFICIRKDVFRKIGGFNSGFSLSEDRDLVIKALKYGKPSVLKGACVKVSTRRVRKYGWPKFLLLHFYSHVFYTIFKRSIKKNEYFNAKF